MASYAVLSTSARQEAALIEEKQQVALNDSMKEVYKCDSCKKNKKPLFRCNFPGCPHHDDNHCTRCANFHHDEDSDHTFDTSKDYVRQVDLSLKLDIDTMQKAAQQMHMMQSSLEDKKKLDNDHKFLTIAAHGFNSIFQYDSRMIGNYILSPGPLNEMVTAVSNMYKNGSLKDFSVVKDYFFGLGDESLQITGACKEGAFAAGAVVFALECCVHTYRFTRGDISRKQWFKDLTVAAASTLASMAGNIGGTAVGAVLGSAIPFVGTAIGGVAGGFLGGLFFSLGAKKQLDESKYFNDMSEQEYRFRLINEALNHFGYKSDDITNEKIFNEKEIGKRYRSRCKEAHPDRHNGSHDAFCTLQSYYTILLAIIQKSDDVKKTVKKEVSRLAITLPGRS